MRINKYLAEAGVSSRRGADELIREKRVLINGKAAEMGAEVEAGDTVTVDGSVVKRVTKFSYYMLNKPKGCVTTVKDDKGRKTVMDFLPKTRDRLYPVGRLDYDTEGLLIITNDGELANRLTHPINEVPKTYVAKIEGTLTEAMLAKLRSGVEIDGVKTKKSSVRIIDENKETTKLAVTITEGRNRQVRKMFEAVGKEVVFLKRIKIGELSLRGLDRGAYRPLSREEVYYLKNI